MQAVYIFNLMSPFICTIYVRFSRLNKELQNKILLFLYSVIAVLIVGTRTVGTGADTIVYYDFYQKALQPGTEEFIMNRFEPLFSLIGLLCARFNFSFTIFNIIVVALTMLFFSKAIHCSSSDVTVSIFLYISFFLFYNMMNQVRQALAMMIVLYAISYLRDNLKKKFIIWVIVASLIHMSSLIVLVLLLIYKLELSKKVIRNYILIGIVSVLTSTLIFRVVSYLPFGHYLSESWRYGAFDKNAILNFIVRLTMLICAMLFFKEISKKNKKISIYYHMIFICTILQAITVLNNAMGRITTFFFLAYLIIIPEIVTNTKLFKKEKKLMYPMLICAFLIYHYVYFKSARVQYNSVWF